MIASQHFLGQSNKGPSRSYIKIGGPKPSHILRGLLLPFFPFGKLSDFGKQDFSNLPDICQTFVRHLAKFSEKLRRKKSFFSDFGGEFWVKNCQKLAYKVPNWRKIGIRPHVQPMHIKQWRDSNTCDLCYSSTKHYLKTNFITCKGYLNWNGALTQLV